MSLNKVIKKTDDLVEVIDEQIQNLTELTDILREYQEFLEDESKRFAKAMR